VVALQRVLPGAALAAVAVTAMLSVATPASADSDLNCEGGPRIFCSLDNASSGEAWTVNGNFYSTGNGKSYVNFACWVGHNQYVSVTYINTAGDQQTATGDAYCSSMYP
jgi:hypothetical protein